MYMAEIVVLHLHRVNVATRHREALTGQKMSRYCPTFCGLWAPSFCGAPVRPNMPNIIIIIIAGKPLTGA